MILQVGSNLGDYTLILADKPKPPPPDNGTSKKSGKRLGNNPPSRD